MPAPGSIALPSSPTYWAIRSSKHADKDQAMTESLDTIDVVVKRTTHEATGIASFELRPAEGGTLPPFTAGAHIDIRLGTGLVRSYSLVNPPGQSDRSLIAFNPPRRSRGG